MTIRVRLSELRRAARRARAQIDPYNIRGGCVRPIALFFNYLSVKENVIVFIYDISMEVVLPIILSSLINLYFCYLKSE